MSENWSDGVPDVTDYVSIQTPGPTLWPVVIQDAVADQVRIAYSIGASGMLTVRDPGVDLTMDDYLFVGRSGNGTLNVRLGASVSCGIASIASRAGSIGLATVEDGGSTWTSNAGFDVASRGNGTLNVEGGGIIASTSSSESSYIGGSAEGVGTVTVSGDGSAWNNSAALSVAGYGSGTLNVENGGSVSNTRAEIGALVGSTGQATVTGNESTWTNSAELNVGKFGNGTLLIADGGAVSNTDSHIGFWPGVTGTVTVAGSGSSWTNSADLYVGGSSMAAGGTGVLNIDGGTVDVAGTLTIWATGSVNLTDGQLEVAQMQSNGGSLNSTGGTLSVQTYNGDCTLDGTTLAPGDSPGYSVINGNLFLEHGGIEIELGGTQRGTLYDYASVTGLLDLDGTADVPDAQFTLLLYDDFAPMNVDTFDILDWGTIDGQFASLNLPDLGKSLAWDTSALYATGEISVVPEPAGLSLLAVAAAVLAPHLVRRRRRPS